MRRRILIWTQHLLGIGHLMRSMNIAQALGEAGYDVMLVSGGPVPAETTARPFGIVRLPPVRAKDELFDALVDLQGNEVTSALLEQRKAVLLEAFSKFSPDCVITETYPFGRRLVQDEVRALIGAARSLPRPPRIVASVRDVLQRPRKDERAVAMAELALSHYDMILVHGDETLIPADASFPEMRRIRHLLHYTGYVGRKAPSGPRRRNEVLISAGGGAVGDALVRAATEAHGLSRLRHLPWTIVTGPLSTAELRNAEGLFFSRNLPDLSVRIAHAALSVSQAGYNTIVETLAGQTPAVVVPFETDREREQITRAACLSERGILTVVRNVDLSPQTLAAAMDERFSLGMPAHAFNLDGQAGTVAAIGKLFGTS